MAAQRCSSAVVASAARPGVALEGRQGEFRVEAAARKAHGAAEDSEERDAARALRQGAAETWVPQRKAHPPLAGGEGES